MAKMNAAQRRYVARFLPTMAAYVVIILVVAWLFEHQPPQGALKYVLAVLPGLPIIGVIVIMARYLVEETDEFMRMRHAMALLVGIGLTLAFATVWGLLEWFAHIEHLNVFWIFPAFCAAWGFASGVLAWVYR